MRHKLPNYLRTYRKGVELTQTEVAYLLGCRNAAKVSRYERFARQPDLEVVFAYEAVFRVPARELFAGVFQHVERTVSRRVRCLVRRLERTPHPRLARKADFLRSVSLGLLKKP